AHHRDVDEVGRRPYLLRLGGYRSIRQNLRELAYHIKGMLALGGVTTAESTLITLLGSPAGGGHKDKLQLTKQ
ncbi:MAG: hypothetical protein VKK05_09445, partial [Synechococcus sp.]|nr:hypothetical protein [Synechococcus sp.]